MLSALVLCACPPVSPPPSEKDGGDVSAAPPVGCDAGSYQDALGACQPAGWTSCGRGFEVDSSGWGCEVGLGAACDAGSMAVPGEGCVAIGWAQCPPGFQRDPSGWNCEPTLPAGPCTGATRAAIGSTACRSVGDCEVAFPPVASSLWVDASFDAGQLDATHFSRISEALAAAAPGATIAVAPGSYAESLLFTKPLKLVGRCAQRVQLTGSPALQVSAVQGVEVEGFTVRDSTLAARVERAGGLTLRRSVLEANRRSAVQALDPGTQLTLEEVVIRGTLVDSATQTFGQGIAASYSAQVALTDVELTQNREVGLFLDRAGTRAQLTRTVISGTLPRAGSGRLGWGIAVQGGATLEAHALVVEDNRVTGLMVQGPSRATLEDAVVRRTSLGLDSTGQAAGVGVMVLRGGLLRWTGGAVEDAPQGLVLGQDASSAVSLSHVTARGVVGVQGTSTFGVSGQGSAGLTLDHVAILRIVGSGVLAMSQTEVSLAHVGLFDIAGFGLRSQDAARIDGAAVEVRRHEDVAALSTDRASLRLTGCVLSDAAIGPLADAGVSGYGAAAARAATLTLESCLVAHNLGAGLYVTQGASATVTSTVVRDTALDRQGEFGQGVVAEGGGRVDLRDVAIVRSHTAGLQVAQADSVISAVRVTVRSTLPNAGGTRGRGANASFGGTLSSLGSAFVDNQQVGLFAYQSRMELIDTVVLGTRADPDGSFGNGVEALTDGSILFIRGAIEGNAGMGAVFAEGAGLLDQARVARHPVGLHAQDGSTVEEVDRPPQSLGARQVAITRATTFEENRTKVSADTVPVPAR